MGVLFMKKMYWANKNSSMSVTGKLPEKNQGSSEKLFDKIFYEKCEAFLVDDSLYGAEKEH